jgi:hypothetical protein
MKLLQNLANGVKFGTKESFMIPLNAFIDEHMPRVVDFCEQFAVYHSHTYEYTLSRRCSQLIGALICFYRIHQRNQ